MKKIRVAPIIRVSTEKQKQRKTSLEVQKNAILEAVERIGGVVPEHLWQYSGHEHATAGWERQKLDKLLNDASKDMFDAVMVVDVSRWSRDNEKSKQGLRVLKENRIRFFVGSSEYDLFDYQHEFILGMGAEVHEMFAKQQRYKSIMSKIEKSKQGYPAVGRLPFGRTFDKKTKQWGIDDDEHYLVKTAVKRYLAGEGIVKIALSLGMSCATLHKALNRYPGSNWSVKIESKEFDIDETIEINIPPLLDDDTIKAIREQADANRTYQYGSSGRVNKNQYMLSRVIFCEHCGESLTGYANTYGIRYYKHYSSSNRPSKCKHNKFIHAKELEALVLLHLVSVMGDPERFKAAIDRAQPDRGEFDELQKEHEALTARLKTIKAEKNKVVDGYSKELFDDDEVKEKMGKLRADETATKERLQQVTSRLENTPDPKSRMKLIKFGAKVMQDAIMNNPKTALKKPFKWQRSIISNAFAGTDADGKRLGVYMTFNEETKQWQYRIIGNCESVCMSLPASQDYVADLLKVNPDELDKSKTDFPLSRQMKQRQTI